LTNTSATLTVGVDFGTIGTKSAIDDNWWPVRADVSRWDYSPNSPNHGLYRPPMQYYSRFRAVSVFDVRPVFYYLIRPGQQPMQYCSSEGVSVFDETRPFYLLD